MLHLETGDRELDHAFRIAVGDLAGNTVPYRAGLLEYQQPVFLAGLDYDTPWTRDAALNVWNGGALVDPAAARATLLAVLERDADGQAVIGGQYWDALVWALGARAYLHHSGDAAFAPLAREAVAATLAARERDEFDAGAGLFRGPACYGDGVSAYPDRYAEALRSSEILAWPAAHPDRAAPRGAGLPMQALSTNCLYYAAYRMLGRDAEADRLRAALDTALWDADEQRYRYLADPDGGCDRHEAMGSALAVLTGAAPPARIPGIVGAQPRTPAGVPCVWPPYERYAPGIGRHSGTVWPHIQALWAEVYADHGRPDLFEAELRTLARHIVRDGQCTELYHPETGLPDGGLQERAPDGVVTSWDSCRRQTWSATGLIRMVLHGMLGLHGGHGPLDASSAGAAPTVHPRLPASVPRLTLAGLHHRGRVWDIHADAQGAEVTPHGDEG